MDFRSCDQTETVRQAPTASNVHQNPDQLRNPGRSESDMPEGQVVLLDERGDPVGVADRVSVHTTATPRHLAFSLFLFDAVGRALLTRRALTKKTWPGVWSNACCGHPRPGEALPDAVQRRLREELGVECTQLATVLPDFSYTAVDASGLVENELCPVLVAHLSSGQPLSLNPAEVMDAVWVPWPSVVAVADLAPALLSPWAVLEIQGLGRHPLVRERVSATAATAAAATPPATAAAVRMERPRTS